MAVKDINQRGREHHLEHHPEDRKLGELTDEAPMCARENVRHTLERMAHDHDARASDIRALLKSLPAEMPPQAEKALYDIVMRGARC